MSRPDKPDVLVKFEDALARLQFASASLAERMEVEKAAELKYHRFESLEPVSSRKDQWRLFRLYAEKIGGEYKNTVIRINVGQVVIELAMDAGGRAFGLIQVQTCIFPNDNPCARAYVNWSQVLPGFHYYNIYQSSATAHLGVMANLRIASLFAKTL